MRRVLLLTLLFSSVIFADKTAWIEGLDAAFEKAQKEQKTVMLFVESRHCRWCVKMKEYTLDNEDVQKKLASYVSVKVMREQKELLTNLPEIQGVPSIFFMTPKKEIIESVIGYFNVEDFLSYINDVEKEIQ